MSELKITENITNLKISISEMGIKLIEQPSFTIKLVEKPYILKVTPPQKTVIKITDKVSQVLKIVKEGPRGPQGDAGTVIEAIAGEDISALKIVRAINATEVFKSDSTSTFANAKCLGITLTGASTGNSIRIQFFGAVGDASFTFPVNTPLYLTTDGDITDDAGVLTAYNTTIGYSLGAGAIFIDLQEPIAL